MQSVVDLDDQKEDSKDRKRKKNKEANQVGKIQRGNLGLCYIDMSLINLCGVPSIWMDSRQYEKAGVYVTSKDILGDSKLHFEPYIKCY